MHATCVKTHVACMWRLVTRGQDLQPWYRFQFDTLCTTTESVQRVMGDWHSLDALFEGYTECPDCGFHFVGCLALVFKKRGKQLQNVPAHHAKKKKAAVTRSQRIMSGCNFNIATASLNLEHLFQIHEQNCHVVICFQNSPRSWQTHQNTMSLWLAILIFTEKKV